MQFNSQYDTYLDLYDSNMTVLKQNDDFCGTNSQITYISLPIDIYIIEVNGYPNTEKNTGQYTLKLFCSFTNEPSTSPTIQYTTSTSMPTLSSVSMPISSAINCGSLIQGNTTLNDTHHYYVFYNPYEDNTITIDLCDSTYDTYLYLFNDNGTLLAANNDNHQFCSEYQSRITYTLPTINDYYIEIYGYQGDYGGYNLRLMCATSDPTSITTNPTTSAPTLPTQQPTTNNPTTITNVPSYSPTVQSRPYDGCKVDICAHGDNIISMELSHDNGRSFLPFAGPLEDWLTSFVATYHGTIDIDTQFKFVVTNDGYVLLHWQGYNYLFSKLRHLP